MSPSPETTAGHDTGCFLCRPDPGLIYRESQSFLAMLGLGPIVEGYTLIASKAHIPSMFDLPQPLVDELSSFTSQVIAILEKIWAVPTITEHGRVGLCLETDVAHEAHCYHAHQLVFPTTFDLSVSMRETLFDPIQATSFQAARDKASHLVDYLYHENPTGEVLVGHAPSDSARQFFRRAMAAGIGRPELQSWRDFPGLDAIQSARLKIDQLSHDL